MAGIDEVLERLITDLAFRRRLREDPAAALQGYDLNEADLELLASQLDDGVGQAHTVEQRTSKSSLFGLFAGLAEGSAELFGDADPPSAIGGRQGMDGSSDVVQATQGSALQPGQSSYEFLTTPSSDDSPSEVAPEAEPDPANPNSDLTSGEDPSRGNRLDFLKLADPVLRPAAPTHTEGDATAPTQGVADLPPDDDQSWRSGGGEAAEDDYARVKVQFPWLAEDGDPVSGEAVVADGSAMVTSVHHRFGDAPPSGGDLASEGAEAGTPAGANEIVLEDGRGREGAVSAGTGDTEPAAINEKPGGDITIKGRKILYAVDPSTPQDASADAVSAGTGDTEPAAINEITSYIDSSTVDTGETQR